MGSPQSNYFKLKTVLDPQCADTYWCFTWKSFLYLLCQGADGPGCAAGVAHAYALHQLYACGCIWSIDSKYKTPYQGKHTVPHNNRKRCRVERFVIWAGQWIVQCGLRARQDTGEPAEQRKSSDKVPPAKAPPATCKCCCEPCLVYFRVIGNVNIFCVRHAASTNRATIGAHNAFRGGIGP